MVTKELFSEAINKMMAADDYHQDINRIYKKYGADGYLIEPDHNGIIIKLLKNGLPKDCDFDAVTSFCLDNNYGRGKGNQYYTTDKNEKVKISKPEELYDYIVSSSSEIYGEGGDAISVSTESK